MTRKLTHEAAILLGRFFVAAGIRPVRGGHIELHFDDHGQLTGAKEHRHVRFAHEDVARQGQQAHNSSVPT